MLLPTNYGFWLPAVVGELKPNRCMGINKRYPIPHTHRCMGINHKYPPPCTQTFAHPLPILLWSFTWHSAPFSAGSCWSRSLLVVVAMVMVVALKFFM